jgi:hypothetical protein
MYMELTDGQYSSCWRLGERRHRQHLQRYTWLVSLLVLLWTSFLDIAWTLLLDIVLSNYTSSLWGALIGSEQFALDFQVRLQLGPRLLIC